METNIELENQGYNIIQLLLKGNLCKSNAEAKRLIYQEQVKVNGNTHNGENIFDPIEIEDNLIIQCRNKQVHYEKNKL